MYRNMFICYFMIATAVFCLWFSLFLLDRTTPKNHFLSWLVLLIAPLFWPIVLPLSIKELIVKARSRRHRQNGIPLEEAIIGIRTTELTEHKLI